MNVVEEKGLIDEVKKARITIELINALEELPPNDSFISHGSSRNMVLMNHYGTTITKSYISRKRWEAENENIRIFYKINEERNPSFREITKSNENYIGLPNINPISDMSRRPDDNESKLPYMSIFAPVRGDLLYEKMKNGKETIEDKLLAATQIARIQQEGKNYRGKNHKDQLFLEDVVRKRPDGQRTSYYFMDRFKNIFLKQLAEYGGLNIPEHLQQNMVEDWEFLVARNLVLAHYKGFNGYYFDGNPRHHVLTSGNRGIISFDFEDRLIVPSLLGQASLLSFGLGDESKNYLEEEQLHFKILDRALLETKFSDELGVGKRDRAERIHNYIRERNEVYNFDLIGENSNEFFRYVGDDDKEKGIRHRERFLSAWRYALLDRNTAWIGHKSRYRAVSELLSKEGIKFTIDDPVRQNTVEQKRHLETVISILGLLKDDKKIEIYQSSAARRLYHQFQELADNSYFSLK